MSAPASLSVRVLNQGKYEAETMLRNGEQLILAVVLPLLGLIALSVTPVLDAYGPSRIDTATPGILALCALSTAFTGQGIATGFDRRYGVLRFLSTTPLGRAGLIAGKVIASRRCRAFLASAGLTMVVRNTCFSPMMRTSPPCVLRLRRSAMPSSSIGRTNCSPWRS